MADKRGAFVIEEHYHSVSTADCISVVQGQAAGRACDFELTFEKCLMCDLEDGNVGFGPLCEVCHEFLYPDALAVAAREAQIAEQKVNHEDLGYSEGDEELIANEGENAETIEEGFRYQSNGSRHTDPTEIDIDIGLDLLSPPADRESQIKKTYLSKYERLKSPHMIAERIAAELHIIEDEIVENLPPEVLLMIFSHLDDVALCVAGQVCQRWHCLGNDEEQWRSHVLKRWPLLISRQCGKTVSSWRRLYEKLFNGVTCKRCFEQGCIQRSTEDDIVNTWRNKRLRSELKNILVDPPDGLCAMPLDKSYSHWQASIVGPPHSPYEGGVFFLHLEIPKSYPMRPPIARFVTRIFHPNVSYHGDIGLDTLRHNWTLALTIPKVLVSIQSLLTDPYCYVAMEPRIARLFKEDKLGFDRVARNWTAKYATLQPFL